MKFPLLCNDPPPHLEASENILDHLFGTNISVWFFMLFSFSLSHTHTTPQDNLFSMKE